LDDFEKELKIGFLEEAEQSITEVESCFLILETDPNDVENINKIFRLAHNLKGSSKAVGFDEFGAFTHEFETFILKVKNGVLSCTPEVVNILLQANDHVVVMINGLKTDLAATFDSVNLLNLMKNFSQVASVQAISQPIEMEVEAISASVTDVAVKYEPTIEEILEAEFAKEAALKNQPEIKIVQKPAIPKSAPVAVTVDESIRVALSKVEALLNSVGEMVILQSVLKEQVSMVESESLKKTVLQLSKISKEIQDSSMSLRMTPVKPTFQKMQRIVRDTAQALNKEINFVLVGEDTELDKTVLEKINDPLVHLIRNSVDHGIENAETRVANDKTEKGTVTLSAYHQSGKLVIEVSDDGGGLNPEKLRKKAIEKNIITENQKMTDDECRNLIFAPGFSTKDAVTDVSGRGVGMDVVKTNITELNGEIKITSVLGQGTTFKIILPLTLAIIDSLIVESCEHKFAVPLSHVHETLRPENKQIQSHKNMGETLLLRGENLPMYRVGDFFGLKSGKETTNMIALVVRSGEKPFCLMVDDILIQNEIVTKPLGLELQNLKGVSGSTILADGKPALILEPQDLILRTRTTLRTDNKQEHVKAVA
jgi:two-component system, chemotaxis family, sensor kinase CheA